MTPSRPTRAILLAAGFGSRMKPLCADLPKPLMPRGNAAHIEHMLKLAEAWGVREVLINIHHNPSPLLSFLSRTYQGPLKIQMSFEPEILGTGGALRRAQWFIQDAPFWVLNTDIVAELDPTPLLQAMRVPSTAAALWVTSESGPRTVELTPTGSIRSFRSKQPGSPGTLTFCGLQLIHPRVVEALPKQGFSSIITAYETLLARDPESIKGCTVPQSRWADLGTPARYLTEVTHSGSICQLDPTAKIHRQARVTGSAIWAGATLGPHAQVLGTVVGRDIHIDVAVDAPTIALDRLPPAPPHRAAETLGWPSADCACSPLPARGSDRTFYRLIRGSDSALVVHYGQLRPENNHYAALARRLHGLGIPVPRILHHSPQKGMLILEDLGCTDLKQAIEGAKPRSIQNHYRHVLDVLAKLQAVRPSALRGTHLQPRFDRDLYRWEHQLFLDCLCKAQLELGPASRRALSRELTGIASELLDYPHRTLVHRDFQSSNILMYRRAPYLIDFQGLRLGCPTYDAASLLCDPYTMLPQELQDPLIRYYLGNAPAGIDRHAFDLAAAQRLTQALGAYARLGSQPDTVRFKSFIAPAATMLGRVLGHLPNPRNLLALMGDLAGQ